MKKTIKFNTKRILATVLIISLCVVGVFSFAGCNKDKNKDEQKAQLTFDNVKGVKAENKIENAQYIPDVASFGGIEVNRLAPEGESQNVDSAAAARAEFAEEVDKFATIYNYAGAGKYMGYNIYEIKDELAFVVDTVPAFRQWFRMPDMREEQGFAQIPYYERWAYYLDYDESADSLSVTRVCWRTRCSYYDFDSGKTVEKYDEDTRIVQYEVMKTDYFKDERGREVVECYIYSVAVDRFNIENGLFHENEEDYKPLEYQYLRNVEDSYLVKYHITAAERTKQGMDIRGREPYGVRREFTVIDYEGYTDFEKTQFDGKDFAFDIDSGNYALLAGAVGISENEYANYADSYNLSKAIVDNFELKNNWKAIYKDSGDAIEAEAIYGPHLEKDIVISNVHGRAIPYGHVIDNADGYTIENAVQLDVSADVYNISKLDTSKKYSLSAALKERTTGKIIVLASDHQLLQYTRYNGSETEGYYTLRNTEYELTASDFRITAPGVYDLVVVLTDEANRVVFDTKERFFVCGYLNIKVEDKTEEGKTYHYGFNAKAGKIVLTVSENELSAEEQ